MLSDVRKKVRFVPTTTRTIDQYKRIDFGEEEPEYALVCNGGILLIHGEIAHDWYQESLDSIRESLNELKASIQILEMDSNRCFDIRFIEELFVFTKSEKPEETITLLEANLNTITLDVFHNGKKVYVIPKKLNKGSAIKRLKEKLHANKIIAAGDSEFDLSMLREADLAFMPKSLKEQCKVEIANAIVHDSENIFSDEILDYILHGC
jgi:hydroxymethylpyrimidine pyrophosphatase-like HAD family hydrolase